MRKIKSILFFTTAFMLAFLIFSCQPGGVDPNPPGGDTTTNPSLLRDSSLIREFLTFNHSFVPDTVSAELYEYDALKRLVRVSSRTQDPGGTGGPLSVTNDTLWFFYTGNSTMATRIIRKLGRYAPLNSTTLQPNFALSQYKMTDEYKFRYDNNGKLINDSSYSGPPYHFREYHRYDHVSNGEVRDYSKMDGWTHENLTTYTLTHQNNNLVEQKNNGVLYRRVTYDNKVSPFTAIQPYIPFFNGKIPFTNPLWSYKMSKNNATSITSFTYGGPPANDTFRAQVDYIYTYRADGYPVSLIRPNPAFNSFYRAEFKYY